jgi:diphosphomevalonate decarboxylase
MSPKATVIAPSNIALIKYWGTSDLRRTLPFNPSLSMTLRECYTRTTVEQIDAATDEVLVRGSGGQLEPASAGFAAGVGNHLDRLRDWAGSDTRFFVATENSFPMGAGMASSASGFAALALSVVAALDRQISPATASVLARQSGSGSAARSVMGGYVAWPAQGSDGAAEQIFPAEHWDLRDVIAILDTTEKGVSSRAGHRLAETSPYFRPRLSELPERTAAVRSALQARDFTRLAPLVEEEAIDLHLIAMSSRPPVFYWRPGTLVVLELVRALRENGLDACATMDAGANVHVICTPQAEAEVVEALQVLPEVERVMRDGVGTGPRIVDASLF